MDNTLSSARLVAATGIAPYEGNYDEAHRLVGEHAKLSAEADTPLRELLSQAATVQRNEFLRRLDRGKVVDLEENVVRLEEIRT